MRVVRTSVVTSLFAFAVLFPSDCHAQSGRAQRATGLNDEAKTIARQVLLHRLLQCGTSLYVYGWIDYDTRDNTGRSDGTAKSGLYLPAGFKDRLTHDEKQVYDQTGVILWFSESRGILESLAVHDTSAFLSAADKLNGVQWDGEAKTDSKLAAIRYRHWRNGQAPPVGQPSGPGPGGEWGAWDKNWLPTGFRVGLRKRNSRWFVVADDLETETPVGEILSAPQPSCADLPIR